VGCQKLYSISSSPFTTAENWATKSPKVTGPPKHELSMVLPHRAIEHNAAVGSRKFPYSHARPAHCPHDLSLQQISHLRAPPPPYSTAPSTVTPCAISSCSASLDAADNHLPQLVLPRPTAGQSRTPPSSARRYRLPPPSVTASLYRAPPLPPDWPQHR
jgi:hypothetical protein